MLVKFIGATERVSGSCSWLKKDTTEFLVDCGMIQGERHDDFENRQPFLFDPKQIKFVLLTHAHLDHCGLIPRLYKEGFIGKVYCTKATSLLAREILTDATKINSFYTEKDMQVVQFSYFEEMKDFKWGKMLPIDNNLFIAIYRSAHILGAVSICISWDKDVKGKSILFTGDIGNNTKTNSYQPLLKHRHEPDEKNGFIVCESTYGSRERDSSECKFEYRIDQLEKIITETLYGKQGHLIIPTFSLHRTQEILFDLYYLLKVKWAGNLYNKKYVLKDYLTKNRFFDPEWVIRNKVYSQLMNNVTISSEIKKKISECYNLYFRLTKKQFEDISKKYPWIENYKGKENHPYSIDTTLMEDQLKSKIQIYLKKSTESDKLHHKFDKEKLDHSLFKDLEQTIEVKKSPVNIICDSPLGRRISQIYSEELTKKYKNGNEMERPFLNKNILDWLKIKDDEVENVIKNLFKQESEQPFEVGFHKITIVDETKADYLRSPSIIITSSGMCDAGPVLGHLEKHLEFENNTILMTGHLSNGTNGYKLSNLSNFSDEEKQQFTMKLRNKELKFSDIKAKINIISGYSGHADQKSLLTYLFRDEENYHYTIPNIFLNHGDNTTREEFKKKILEHSKDLNIKYGGKYQYNTNVIIPLKKDGWYNLEKAEWVEEPLNDNQDMAEAINKLTKAIENLTNEISIMNKNKL